MKIVDCDKCDLCKSRSHISIPKGNKPSNVLVIFGKEPISRKGTIQLETFVDSLNDLLEGDIYLTYAIRCKVNQPIKMEHIKACRVWLANTLKKVNPYLVILMGSISVRAIFGDKHRKLPTNIFFDKKIGKRKRKYFIGDKITGMEENVSTNLGKLLTYIKESYE